MCLQNKLNKKKELCLKNVLEDIFLVCVFSYGNTCIDKEHI